MKLLTKDKDLAYRVMQVRELLMTQTARNSGFVFAGNLASTFLSVIATMLVSRALGPSNFGKLAIFTSLYTTILGFTDFGLGTAAVKIISAQLRDSPRRAGITMKVIIYAEFLSGLIVGVVGLLFAPQIAVWLGGKDLLPIIQMAFVAGVFASTGAFIAPFLSAFQQFLKSALFGVAVSFLKTAGVVALFFLLVLNLKNVIFLYTAVNILAFFAGFLLVPKNYLVKSKPGENGRAAQEVFHFSKWVLLSYFASVISSRLDVFLLARYRGSTEVGLYAAAQQLALLLPLLIGAITTALLPRISRMKRRDEFLGYAKRVLLGSAVLAILAIPALLLAPFVVQLVYGNKFSSSVIYFQILAIGYLFALVANPLSLVFYAKNKPNKLTFINYLNLVIIVVLDLLIIPRYGALGAAVCFSLNNLIAASFIIPMSMKEIRNTQR